MNRRTPLLAMALLALSAGLNPAVPDPVSRFLAPPRTYIGDVQTITAAGPPQLPAHPDSAVQVVPEPAPVMQIGIGAILLTVGIFRRRTAGA